MRCRERGRQADLRLGPSLTTRPREPPHIQRMEDPTHVQENRFWDQVADWLLGIHTSEYGPLSEAEILALLRESEDESRRPLH